jgi:hypothetical protein
MSDRIQIKRDSSTVWSSVNPVLSDGEFGYERDSGKIKIGNGVTPWNSLAYYSSEDYPSAIAGEALGGHRAVIQSNGLLYYASTSNILHLNRVVGITVGASSSGASTEYVSEGAITESSWSWNTTTPIYLAENGMLTQSPINVSGFTQIIGMPISATSMYVSLKTPIILN